MSITFSARDSWVALVGRASVVDDQAKLEELWSTFAEAWLPGGPEDPNATLIKVDVDRAEYWDSPGSSKVTQVVNLIKAKVTGNTVDGENEVVDL